MYRDLAACNIKTLYLSRNLTDKDYYRKTGRVSDHWRPRLPSCVLVLGYDPSEVDGN